MFTYMSVEEIKEYAVELASNLCGNDICPESIEEIINFELLGCECEHEFYEIKTMILLFIDSYLLGFRDAIKDEDIHVPVDAVFH